ncbi:hypothetical protein HYR54_00565 [Candidatus Acetothermia bacterium]|nr:hypothetical protein [Candidatus Acetothermia bacterium]
MTWLIAIAVPLIGVVLGGWLGSRHRWPQESRSPGQGGVPKTNAKPSDPKEVVSEFTESAVK